MALECYMYVLYTWLSLRVLLVCHVHLAVIRAGPNAIFQALNTRWFFRANIRILVPEKHTIKNNINNPYILPGTDFDSVCIFS